MRRAVKAKVPVQPRRGQTGPVIRRGIEKTPFLAKSII